MKKPSETALVKACLDYLRLRGIMAWRTNSGAMTVESKGKKRFVRFNGAQGCSDVLGILPGGMFLAVECKMPGKNPTPLQRAFLDAVVRAGGASFVIHDLGELQDCLLKAKSGADLP